MAMFRTDVVRAAIRLPCTLVLAATAVCGLAWAAAADQPQTPDKTPQTVEDVYKIQAIIARQIEAFRRDDADEAYSYAAPEVKRLFPTKERFMAMVRQGYAAIYRPQFYFFGQLGGDENQKVQEVQLVGPQGRSWVALYRLLRQPDGTWRIAAVILGLSNKGQKT